MTVGGRSGESMQCSSHLSDCLMRKMASITTSLLYIWPLLPLFTAGDVPLPCVFPFTYKQNVYSSCTEVDSSDGQPWCATTSNYDEDQQWRSCVLNEYGGNSGGKGCVFPFIYKDRTFYTCTNEDAELGRFWCATTGSFDNDKEWSYCADNRLRANSQGPCVFPFRYQEKQYSSCTTDGSSVGKLWCSLTSNYDVDRKWAYCDPSEHRPCVFPFIYKEKTFSKCTSEGAADNTLWCSTTSSYDVDGKWKACSTQEYEGNSKGQPCVFPFSYKDRTFFTCTNEDIEDTRFWCATTGSYDKSKKWSYCADTRLDDRPTGPCAFPFIYQGKSYSTCKTDKKEGKLWCSLTSNYDEDPQWRYCDPSEHRPCTFPFIFKSNPYFACTREGAGDNVLWCATTDDYDRDTKWKVCALEEYGGSSNGKPCTFPFIYHSETFYNCTTENSENGLFWCATTANYDQDEEWSYCPDESYNLPPLHLSSMSGESALGPKKHCLCIQTISRMVPPSRISKVTIYPESPQCAVPEVIATLKSGVEICLDPTAAWVRKVMAAIQKNHYQTHQ